MKKWKQALCITLIIMGVLVFFAVVIGVLNATVLDGAINFGWNNYRYDSTGYTVGEGSVFDTSIASISVDWRSGTLRIEACEDDFISISEQSREMLTDATRVHWKAEGCALTIKSRESGWFFGSDVEKSLILRIPQKMFAQLDSITVESGNGNVALAGVGARSITLNSKAGDLNLSLAQTPDALNVTAKKGQVAIQLPRDASFSLEWTKNEGFLVSNFPVSSVENTYVVGNGASKFCVVTDEGDLIVDFTP
jgi:hypothetical protein